jgi:hypothetical protein
MPLSQTTTPNNPNLFAFILLLSGGPVGEIWEPSNKKKKLSVPIPPRLSLFTYSTAILTPSHSLFRFQSLHRFLPTPSLIDAANYSYRSAAPPHDLQVTPWRLTKKFAISQRKGVLHYRIHKGPRAFFGIGSQCMKLLRPE